jgi:hypothetical protein
VAIGDRGAGSNATTTGTATSLAVSFTAGTLSGVAAGDLAVFTANVGAGSGVSMTGPVASGWTELVNVTNSSSTAKLGIWVKALVAADITTGSVTVTCSAARKIAASLYVLTGANYDTISATTEETAVSSGALLPTVTPTNDSSRLIGIVTGNSSTANQARVFTPPTGWTQQALGQTTDTGGRLSAVIFSDQLSTGTGGVATGTENYAIDATFHALEAVVVVAPNFTAFTGSPSDPVGVTDAATAVQALLQAPADPVGVSDSATDVLAVVRTQADPVGVTDTATGVLGSAPVFGDPVGVTDSVAQVVTAAKSTADPVGVTDSASGVLTAAAVDYFGAPSDAVNVTDSAVGVLVLAVVNIYTPPQYRMHQVMEGSLRYYIDTSTTVYKLNGVWGNITSPGVGQLDGATYIFNTPTVVSDAVAAELAAYGVGTLTTQ